MVVNLSECCFNAGASSCCWLSIKVELLEAASPIVFEQPGLSAMDSLAYNV